MFLAAIEGRAIKEIYPLSHSMCLCADEGERKRVGEREREEKGREREGGVARPIAPKFCSRHFENQFDYATYKFGQNLQED